LFILSGSLRVDLGDANGCIDLAEGDSAYIPAAIARRFQNLTSAPVRFMNVVVRDDQMDRFARSSSA
jgi:mannose-6-phosphate isomerase-like protein (cupin superfamily)